MKWIPNSLIDYPGKTAAVLFLPGCNLRCPYCHNPELALEEPEVNIQALSEFFSFLESRKGFLDGVVVSGGEPTILGKWFLGQIFDRIKNMGYPIKLDTNGTHPEVLQYLIEKQVVDYVALSIKPELIKYSITYDDDFFCDTVFEDEDCCFLSVFSSKYSGIINLLITEEPKVLSEYRIVAVPSEYFKRKLMLISSFLMNWHGKIKLKLHRFNKGQGILNPAFYEGVKMYDESDYQRLAEIVRDNGLDCEVV